MGSNGLSLMATPRRGQSAVALLPSFAFRVDRELLRLSARQIGKDLSELYVSPLGRVGFSGARLFKCHISRGRIFVVKINKWQKISSEAEAIEEVHPFLAVELISRNPITYESHGALIYPFAGGHDIRSANKVRELQDLLFGSGGCSDSRIVRILRNTYNRVEDCKVADKHTFTLRDEYVRYLRDHRSRRMLLSFFGDPGDTATLQFGGVRIANPVRFVEDLRFNSPIIGKRGPIHGDLHPKNIMVDQDDDVHLIDFEWARKIGHRIIDHTLMECSCRFMMFPRFANTKKQLAVDIALLSFDGYEEIPRLTADCVLAPEYARLARMLKVIRSSAARFLMRQGEAGFVEYLASQFMVLYGLIAYEGYQTVAAVRALGLIGQRLKRSWEV